MEEDKQEVTPPRGNEWEVVSLTASAYAAAPSSETNEDNEKEPTKEDLSSSQMMSKSEFEHLVFPPSEHEDLPVESDDSEKDSHEPVQKSDIGTHDVAEDKKIHEQLNELPLAASDVLGGAEIDFEEKDSQGTEGKEGHGLNPYTSDSIMSKSVELEKDSNAPPTGNPSMQNCDKPSDPEENVKRNNCSSPLSEDWWKKHAASLYARTKEADVYWSIFIAASIVGIVFIGKKWRSSGTPNVDKSRSWFLSFVCSA